MKKKPWKRLSQSDSEAVMRLVDEYQSSIKRIIVSVLKGQWPDAVDDILQDTYEEICRQLNLIEEAENRRAYVCKIAARLAIQAHRRLGRDLPLDEDVPAPEDLSFNLDTILPCSLSPSDKRLLKRVYEEQDNIVCGEQPPRHHPQGAVLPGTGGDDPTGQQAEGDAENWQDGAGQILGQIRPLRAAGVRGVRNAL